MANTKSAKKSILVSKRNQERNSNFKSKMKTFIKKAQTAIEQKAENKTEVVKVALQVIDKTASKGIIKKQTASRKKSNLSVALNKSNK
ncbi:MAG: 30S ribosomal protein S20 [Candidatus Margulisbacteria bacterium]|nr:30S ribosomal protein S20 [Candidatus Margulisiibacteriota bacterium]